MKMKNKIFFAGLCGLVATAAQASTQFPVQLFNYFSANHTETVAFEGCTNGVFLKLNSVNLRVNANTNPYTAFTLLSPLDQGETTCHFLVNDSDTMGDQNANVIMTFDYQDGYIGNTNFDVKYPNYKSMDEVQGGPDGGTNNIYLGIRQSPILK